jgi:hypothetical protein
MVLLTADSLVHGYVGITWPFTQLGQGTIRDDGGKPGRHLRRPFELIQVPVGRQESILHRVFSVVWVSNVSMFSSTVLPAFDASVVRLV